MKKGLICLIVFLFLLCGVACSNFVSTTEQETESPSEKYSVGAYYSTKRDRVYIYFDESEQVAYRGSKQGSTIHTFNYEGSILDKENGATDTSSNCTYIIEGNTIKKYNSSGSEIQSYSIIGYDVAMHKDLK